MNESQATLRRFVAPSRLTAAREFRGITKKALAEAIGVTPMAISGYEGGNWQPASEVIKEIAQILEFPDSWFFQDELFVPKAQALTFRSQSRMTAITRDQARQTWALAAHIALHLKRDYNLPHAAVPDLSRRVSELSVKEAEVAARNLRDQWRLGRDPIPNMVHLLESKGIMCFWTDIPGRTMDAYCSWSDDMPVIVLNSNERSGERLRFNLAHELGHLVLHRDDILRILDDDEDDAGNANSNREKEAHRFASAFLMPAETWAQETPLQVVLDAFLDLKRRWGVSVQAMLRRSFDLGILSEWQYENAMTKVSIRRWRTAEPEPLPAEQSLLHRKVLELMADRGEGAEDLAQRLSVKLDVLETLMPIATQFRRKSHRPRPKRSSTAEDGDQQIRMVK